ncbi:unnamed protein product [Linum tenue]|uniref:Ribosome biogenesis protein WDR12 homolog n=1 Tax=Linum tenue TaxID=586396 RepID=A0AAV0KJ52_9ROSI|nr:unnamed protein product [Linum tenue]
MEEFFRDMGPQFEVPSSFKDLMLPIVEMEPREISARFFTNSKLPYRASTTFNHTISTTFTHDQLSNVVNDHFKSRKSSSRPFVFLIHGKLFPISLGLDQFLLDNEIYVEESLEIEYTLPMKEEVEPLAHAGSVSAVDGSCPRFIVTGCEDGKGRLWNDTGLCTHILERHTGSISSVSILNPLDNDATLVTASEDNTLRLWKLDTKELEKFPRKIKPFKTLSDHSTKGVWRVAANPSGSRFCSGSFNTTVKVWQTYEAASEDYSGFVKKRKTECEAKESQLEDNLVCSLEGHVSVVSSVAWPVDNTIYSASWDGTVREWDVEKCSHVSSKFYEKSFTCLSVGGSGSNILAAGAFDGKLKIYDAKLPGAVHDIFSHDNRISACQWHCKDTVYLLSASLDGRVMVWDLRIAGHTVIESSEHSVLCADWWQGDRVISDGADAKLRISARVPLPSLGV